MATGQIPGPSGAPSGHTCALVSAAGCHVDQLCLELYVPLSLPEHHHNDRYLHDHVAALQRAPVRVVTLIGAAIVLLHNLLDRWEAVFSHRLPNLWVLLNERGFLYLHGHRVAIVYFPFLAWFGIMCLGYGAGLLLTAPFPLRRKRVLGMAALCSSVLLRSGC